MNFSVSDVKWTKVPDEECNQQDAIYKGVNLSIYSTQNGDQWAAYDRDEEEIIDDGLDNAEAAKAAALRYVIQNL